MKFRAAYIRTNSELYSRAGSNDHSVDPLPYTSVQYLRCSLAHQTFHWIVALESKYIATTGRHLVTIQGTVTCPTVHVFGLLAHRVITVSMNVR